MLSVTMTSPERVLFEGKASRVIVPGEQGTFEALVLHRPMISRLLKGVVRVDGKSFPIRRGVVHIVNDAVTMVVELVEPPK
jgi:F-type H+-transporting ATPase subunit epsilon